MLIMPHACFIHVPKTGGWWVRNALLRAVPGAQNYNLAVDGHIGWAECPYPLRFRFAFVRNPYTWYQSYWRYKMGRKWAQPNILDETCRANVFAEFVENAATRLPGIYTDWVDIAIGDPQEIDFVGRFETLQQDLVTALELADETYDLERLLATPPVNAAPAHIDAPLTEQLCRLIYTTERSVFERFQYPRDWKGS